VSLNPNLDSIRKLLDSGDKETARQQIEKLLYRDSTNTYIWWLYVQVTEDKKLQYIILSAMRELPPDAYTAKAQAMLACLPYQEAQPNNLLFRLAKRRPKQKDVLLIAAGCAVVFSIVLLGMVLFLNTTKTPSAASASLSTVAHTPPLAKFVVVSAVLGETPTPQPTENYTVTPPYTPTPQPTENYTVTPSYTPTPDQADVLGQLQAKLHKNARDLIAITNETLNLLNDPDPITAVTIAAVTKNIQQIQKLRGEMMFINLSAVSNDTRFNVVVPVTIAFTNYATTALQLIDFKLKAAPRLDEQIIIGIVTATPQVFATATNQATQHTNTATITSMPTCGPSGQSVCTIVSTTPAKNTRVPTATPFDSIQPQPIATIGDPWSQIVALTKDLQFYLDNLNKGLTNYQRYTMQTVVKDHLSPQAVVISSTDTTVLDLEGGTYTITYELDVALPENGSISLVSAKDSIGIIIKLVGVSTQDKYGHSGGTQVVQIPAGSYQGRVTSAKDWVIAFDPQ